ncbi:MAG TPA: outer membrane beta-barrel family protein [Bacteroidota bacterium]|nr:outer membrane beta-barrel family protein [Bacteroidota bacterium]
MSINPFHYILAWVLFWFSWPPIHTLAQSSNTATVRGVVVDDSSKASLQYVNALLLKKTDSTLVTGSVTESTGKFELKNIPWGEYFVQYGLVGYVEKSTPVFTLDAQHKHLNLGLITLTSRAVSQEAVTITADKPEMIQLIDRMVYNIDQDVLSKAESASDVLENIPSVQIDLNGEVLLRGSSRVLLMINGRRSPLLEKQEGTFLEQLSAGSIEKIEVITTPSARYRAEGKSGIINIVLKKDTPLGTHGNLTAHIGNDGRHNGNTRINYSPGNFNVYGSASVRRDNRNRINSDERAVASPAAPTSFASTYTDDLRSFAHPVTQLFTLGLDFHVDSSNSFGLSGTYFQNSFTRNDSSDRTLKNSRNIVLTEYDRNGSGDEFDKERSITANFHHTFSRSDHKLRLEFATSGSPQEDDFRFTNIYVSPAFPTAYDNSLISQNDSKTQLSAEYSNAFTRTSALEAGYSADISRTNLEFYAENFDPAQNRFIEDSAKTSSYRFNESIHSLYATYKRSFGKFGFLAGFRVEQDDRKSDLVTLDSVMTNNYFDFFPSVHLAYKMSRVSELKLSFSRRTSRPRPRDLDPFPEYRDPKNLSFGNPSLLPEYLHSFELGCQIQYDRVFIQPILFYRRESNTISSIKELVNRSTLRTTKQNAASARSAGMELIFSWHAGDFFNGHLSTTGLYEELDATNIGNAKFQSRMSWSGTLTTNLNITKGSRLQIHSHVSSLRLTPQGEYFPSSVVNLGLRQELWDGKLSLMASASDIFGTLKRHFELVIPRLRQTIFNTRESRALYIGFTYRLGSIPKKSKEEEFHYEDEE